jgi:osmotically-inducible protein OsmY
MPANATIEDAIKESLDLDPRPPDADQLAVAVDAGTATLRGTVGTYSQPRAAVNDDFETDGRISLTGTVNYQFESDAAYDDVADIYDVTGVTNDLTVANP